MQEIPFSKDGLHSSLMNLAVSIFSFSTACSFESQAQSVFNLGNIGRLPAKPGPPNDFLKLRARNVALHQPLADPCLLVSCTTKSLNDRCR